MGKLRLIVVDDHAIIREGLKRLIEPEADMEIVGEASNGAEGCTLAASLQPDLVLMDISMPILSGIEATRRLVSLFPAIKVIGLTVHEDHSYVRELLAAGASGYVLKRAATIELISAIRTVAAGNVFVDPRITNSVIGALFHSKSSAPNEPVELSERELAVIRGIAQGYSNKEIAARLNVSVKTIETYKARSMEKLGLKSRVDLVRLATARGWLNA